jgi:hypothetical protein
LDVSKRALEQPSEVEALEQVLVSSVRAISPSVILAYLELAMLMADRSLHSFIQK